MKEREVILKTTQIELTTQPVNPTLKTGEKFMPTDSRSSEVNPEQGAILSETGVERPSVSVLRKKSKTERQQLITAARAYLESLGGRTPTFEERQSLRFMEQMGLELIGGGSGQNPLTDEARELLRHGDIPTQITINLQRVLLENGITQDQIEENRSSPEVLIALLQVRQRLEEESETQRAAAAAGGSGGQGGPPHRPAGPSPDSGDGDQNQPATPPLSGEDEELTRFLSERGIRRPERTQRPTSGISLEEASRRLRELAGIPEDAGSAATTGAPAEQFTVAVNRLRESLAPYLESLDRAADEQFTALGYPPEYIEQLQEKSHSQIVALREREARELKDAKAALIRHISSAKSAETLDQARQAADGFLEDVRLINDSIKDKEREELKLDEKLNELVTSQDVGRIKEIITSLAPHIREHYHTLEERGPDMPQNLEELVTLIMNRASTDWQVDGEHALMEDTDRGDGKMERIVNVANFYEWIRKQMYWVHDFNPDSDVNFFSDEKMGVKTSFRTITFYEIIFTDSFFKQRRTMQEFRGAKNDQGERQFAWTQRNSPSPDYEVLRDKLLNETFLLQVVRNGDFNYNKNKGTKESFINTLKAILDIDPLTKSDRLRTILTLPSMRKRALGETSQTGSMLEKKKYNFIFGEAIRRAWGAYMYLQDYEMLRQFLGDDAVFFQKEFDEYSKDEKNMEFHKTGKKQTGKGHDFEEGWFDENGRLKDIWTDKYGKERNARDEFMEYTNLHLGPQTDIAKAEEIRERMVLSIMQRTGISYNEAKIVEVWAYSMSHFTGIAARGDTKSVGFDWWTRGSNTIDYRYRQEEETRRATFGRIFTLLGFKRTILTFMEAAKDAHNRSMFEIVQGGQGLAVDLEGNPITKDVDYERRYEKLGNYVAFVDTKGQIVTQLRVENEDIRITDYKVKEDRDEYGAVTYSLKYVTDRGQELDPEKVIGYHPIKQNIVFKDADGNEVDFTDAWSYELDKEGKPVFKDRNGNVIGQDRIAGLNLPRIVERSMPELRFKTVTERQFWANHVERGSVVFTLLMEGSVDGVDLDIHSIVEGHNPVTGMPILNEQKLVKLKKLLRNAVVYSLSTWEGTDYTKLKRNWYREYDELDKNGNPVVDPITGSPKRHLVFKEESILSSMFDDEVKAFIQLEVGSNRRTFKDLDGKTKPLSDLKIDVFHLENYHDLSEDAKRALKLAVWEGAWTYLFAKEIQAHRDPRSTLSRYGFDELKDVYLALRDSGLMYADEEEWIRENTVTGSKRVFGEEFLTALGQGNLEGFWQMILMLAKQGIV